MGSTQSTRPKSGEWVAPQKTVEFLSPEGREMVAGQELAMQPLSSSVKWGQSSLPLGSVVFSNASCTMIYIPKALSNMQGCVLWVFVQLCVIEPPANPSERWNQSLIKFPIGQSFSTFFLDLNVSIPHFSYTLRIYRMQYSSLARIISLLYVFFIRAHISSENVKILPTHGQHPAKKIESLYKACQMGFGAYLIMNHESFLDRWCNHIRE